MGFGFEAWGLGLAAWGLGLAAWGLGLAAWGLGPKKSASVSTAVAAATVH